ncbi:MAG: hypothetical protein OXT74_04125 [Candidatus Poribacteria bacterium]|nr:hypothetical protein [Candidatus Poribacteria bacterium]
MDWGDTFGVGLGAKTDKYLLVWTPKNSSEAQILPGFDSEDGKLRLKMKGRPGAWVSWVDEAKIAVETSDDYERVRRSVQELERNARQVVDFADGVLTDITVQHLGKSLTLSELSQEVLKVELAVPSSAKTGSYILANSGNGASATAKVIVPEQTNIHQVHLNEDELFESIAATDCDALLVVFRTHARRYPDLVDIRYCLTLDAHLRGNSKQDDIVSRISPFKSAEDASGIRILPTAAVYDPLEQDVIQLAPIALDGTSEQIDEAISGCSSMIDGYVSKASQQAFQLMSAFQQRIETRLQALVLQPGQRVHDKVWDELVNHDLRNRMLEFAEFLGEYIGEQFDSKIADAKRDELQNIIDPMIESWQIYDLRQTTLKSIILSGYKLANQVLDRATGILYNLLFERYFIESGYAHTIEAVILENGELVDEVHLPSWTKKTVRDRLHRVALNTSIHPKQIERLRTLWLELLQVANFASRHRQQFETVIQPLVDPLLMPKQSSSDGRLRRSSRKKESQFSGFEIPDEEFQNVINRLKDSSSIIKRWISNAPKERNTLDQYYATLWMILTDGRIRELLTQNFSPLCDINLSIPLEAKRLIDLVLSGQIIIPDEKDLNGLKRNLDRALLSKSGRGLREATTPSILEIHGDTLFCLLREELLEYQQTLEKRALRIANPKVQKRQNGRKKGQTKTKGVLSESATETLDWIEEEKPRVAELIEFLTPYTNAAPILIDAGIDSQSSELDQIRRHQVMNFDLQELPPIEKTWLENAKSVDDYPNLRAFLLEYQLPISTTGRFLMNLRKASSTASGNGDSTAAFDVVLDLVQELKNLQDAGYKGGTLKQFADYISEKLWRWEFTQITADELPTLIKEKVLSTTICYEKEVESLLEYVERYDQLLETKIASESEMDHQRKILEQQFQDIVNTIL